MTTWDTFDARLTIARWTKLEAERKAALEVGPCPHCGALAEVDMLDVSTPAGPAFIPGTARCSARCWELDPEGYLESVDALATTRPSGRQTVQEVPDPLPEGPKRQNVRIARWVARSGE